MADYKISGVWRDEKGVITHYAMHKVTKDGIERAVKTSKATAIRLLDGTGKTAETWLWNYKIAMWVNGEVVSVVSGITGKYLRSNKDDKLTDNLSHLINYDWIAQ